MALDERYGSSVSSLSPLFFGGDPPDLRGPMDHATTMIRRASSFCLSPVVLTAFFHGPQENRWRALAPEETRCEIPDAMLGDGRYSVAQPAVQFATGLWTANAHTLFVAPRASHSSAGRTIPAPLN